VAPPQPVGRTGHVLLFAAGARACHGMAFMAVQISF